jgi:para-nitrobenzyl esterase
MGPSDTLPVGEDCLTLHVWTPGLDNAKRPVMVWLHGAPFSYGLGQLPTLRQHRLPA